MEKLELSEERLEKFLELNSNLWKSRNKNNSSDKYIYINFIMVTKDIAWMLPKLIYAKALQEETGCKPIVIDWKYDENIKKILDSFGFEYVTFRENVTGQLPQICASTVTTLNAWFKNLSGEEIKELIWKDIPVGMHMYEDMLRSSELSTIRTVRNKTVFKKMISLFTFMNQLYDLCQKKTPAVVVGDDFPYNEGLAVAIESHFGAHIMHMGIIHKEWDISYIDETNNKKYCVYRHEYLKRFIKNKMTSLTGDEYKAWVEKYLSDRFAGKNGIAIDRVAYLNKSVCTREDLVKQLGIDSSKKNVIFMAHVFSDATFQGGNIPFRDNYDWTEKTLQHMSKIKDVNWLIKLHPARRRYNDSMDSIDAMVEKYVCDNIQVFPEEYSSESLLTVADALITVCGTAGVEYPCFGIPVIAAGDAFYCDFGFTKHPKNSDEYFEMLSEICKLERLSDEQIEQAKKVLYLYGHIMEESFDEFDREITNEFNSRLVRGDLTEDYQTKQLDKFIEKYEKNELVNLGYFKAGQERTKCL